MGVGDEYEAMWIEIVHDIQYCLLYFVDRDTVALNPRTLGVTALRG